MQNDQDFLEYLEEHHGEAVLTGHRYSTKDQLLSQIKLRTPFNDTTSSCKLVAGFQILAGLEHTDETVRLRPSICVEAASLIYGYDGSAENIAHDFSQCPEKIIAGLRTLRTSALVR
jgi:hypothetical protein